MDGCGGGPRRGNLSCVWRRDSVGRASCVVIRDGRARGEKGRRARHRCARRSFVPFTRRSFVRACVRAINDLVVLHVLGGGGELLVSLDDFVDGVEEIFFADGFAALANGEHAGFGAHGVDLGAGGVGTQTG